MKPGILIVDDASIVRRQVRTALESAGYAVIEASDGVEALEQLDTFPATRLIVNDVHMPNMNGLELLEQLRERDSTIPVIMLTAEADHEMIRRAKALGAKGWLVKPLKMDALLAAVRKALAMAELAET